MAVEDVQIMCEDCRVIYPTVDEFLVHGCKNAATNTDDSSDLDSSVGSKPDLSSSIGAKSGPSSSGIKSGCQSSSLSSPSYWTDEATKLLLKEIKEREGLTKKGLNTKKKMWQDISNALQENGFNFSWEQVQGRIKTLTTNLKKTKDHNNKSGNDRKVCPYMDELDDLFEGNPSITPKATTGTSILKRKTKTDDVLNKKDDATSASDEDQEDKTKTKCVEVAPVIKKRKSGSQEIVEFLRDYTEKQKQEKESQLEERRKMHNEKMGLFKQFIDALKKIGFIHITELPDEMLVAIIKFIPITDMVNNLKKVNKKFCSIIENSSDLYKYISFDDCFSLDKEFLQTILKHTKNMQKLEIASQQILIDQSSFNFMMTTCMAEAKQLSDLDLTGCPLSDLSFIPGLKSLQSLNLSSTQIRDEDLVHLCTKNLVQLTHLYLSFNKLKMISVLEALKFLSIICLDTCGIPCTSEELGAAVVTCTSLDRVHLTFKTSDDHERAIAANGRQYRYIRLNTYLAS